jgi:hypothetical protein
MVTKHKTLHKISKLLFRYCKKRGLLRIQTADRGLRRLILHDLDGIVLKNAKKKLEKLVKITKIPS